MGELEEKLNAILGDQAAMGQIMALAQSLSKPAPPPPAEEAAQQELVYPSFDPHQLVQASAQPVSMEPACPLSQEDLQQVKELLPTLSGVLLPGQEMPVSIGGCPALQLTFADGSQTRLYLDVSDEIDLAVDQEGPLPAPCYAVEEEQLAPLREIICSHFSPQPSQPE